jgi:putative transport protein
MEWIAAFLTKYPELVVFLAIGLGYILGGIKFGDFSFGPVTGSLFAGLLIGMIAEVPISAMAKSFLFLLFLFGIGYSVGPQFLQAMRRGGVQSVLLALVCTSTGLAVAYIVASVLGLDPGFAAGLLSGALTQSPAMGTATEALNALPLPEAERLRLVGHVAIADAVCYLFGAAGAIWFCSAAAPRLLGVDLVADAKALEASLGIKREAPGLVSGYRQFEFRAYRVGPGVRIVGDTIGAAEARAAEHRLFILRLRRGGGIMEARPDLVVEAGDVLAVSGPREAIVQLVESGAEEIEDRDLLSVPFVGRDVLLSESSLAGKTLAEVAKLDWTRAVYLRSIRRGAVEIPRAEGVVLERGDVLQIVGPEPTIEHAAPRIGPVIAPTTSTDFVVLGLAIFLGGLIGASIIIPVGGIAVALGTSIGALVAGLVVGFMRTRHPLFGRIPDGAVALMTALGLAAFVAMTGLQAGPHFLQALRETGLSLLLGGVVVTLTPLLVGLYFGRYVLRMNPVILLGALAGAMSMTAAMAAVQARADSPVPVFGYTPAYPVAQILLTLWGTIIVVLVAGPA